MDQWNVNGSDVTTVRNRARQLITTLLIMHRSVRFLWFLTLDSKVKREEGKRAGPLRGQMLTGYLEA